MTSKRDKKRYVVGLPARCKRVDRRRHDVHRGLPKRLAKHLAHPLAKGVSHGRDQSEHPTPCRCRERRLDGKKERLDEIGAHQLQRHLGTLGVFVIGQRFGKPRDVFRERGKSQH
ncbi:MAG: hypothetical protein WCI05_12205 [Myxococcales bacterium]